MSFQSGMDAFKAGNYQEAADAFHDVITENDQDHKAWNALGVSFTKMGLHPEADICFKNALAFNPENEVYLKNRKKSHSILLEKGKTLVNKKIPFDKIVDEIIATTGKGIKEANKEATDAFIAIARKAETDTLINAGIEIFRWITVTDSRTCDTCMALNGRVYKVNVDGVYVNMDTRQYLEEDLEELASEFGVEDWIVTDANGPPIHHQGECRCHFEQILSYEQYMNSPIIRGVISPLNL